MKVNRYLLKKFFFKPYWITSKQMGMDLVVFVFFIYRLPIYFFELIKFIIIFKRIPSLFPCVHDSYDSSGQVNSEYFWQDLLCAQLLLKFKIISHLDVGSRIDGFVANIISKNKIHVLDVRPLDVPIKNLKFIKADLIDSPDSLFVKLNNFYTSISCLHTIEHFGLGRYGDAIKVDAYKIAIKRFSKFLKKNGLLYLSFPIGRPRIEFNAHRVFSIREMLDEFKLNNLKVLQIFLISNDGHTKVSSKNLLLKDFKRDSLCLCVLKK